MPNGVDRLGPYHSISLFAPGVAVILRRLRFSLYWYYPQLDALHSLSSMGAPFQNTARCRLLAANKTAPLGRQNGIPLSVDAGRPYSRATTTAFSGLKTAAFGGLGLLLFRCSMPWLSGMFYLLI